jgi:hypothetical protein
MSMVFPLINALCLLVQLHTQNEFGQKHTFKVFKTSVNPFPLAPRTVSADLQASTGPGASGASGVSGALGMLGSTGASGEGADS